MSYFNGAYRPQFYNSNLIDVAGNFIMSQQSSEDLIVQQGILALERNSAIDAMHNSQERFPPPKCHPETRQIILANFMAWIEGRAHSLSEKKRILWLYGPAGAGKSSIAQTIAELFDKHILKIAASFFFTRGKERRGTITYFVSTIAYQLTTIIPELRDDIGKVVARNPEILRLSLDVQIQRLIVEPFHSLISRMQAHGLPQQRYLVIVDGLDECEGDENQKLIISHIASLLLNHNLPFTFLIASRPEPQIANSFQKDERLADITTEYKLDPSDEDIRTFLLSGFYQIRNSHPGLASLEGPWPSHHEIHKLVNRSSGYFIYASTVIKFISDEDRNPVESLKLVLSVVSSPFSGLDALYTQILSTVPQHNQPHLMSILDLQTASNCELPLERIEQLLQLSSDDIHIILRRLHSLLVVTDGGIFPHHASFFDFLENKERSGVFHVDGCVGHSKMAKDDIKRLKEGQMPARLLMLDSHICGASRLLNDDAEFLEDLQAVSIGSWKTLFLQGYGLRWGRLDHPKKYISNWIDSFARLPTPPVNIIQQFLDIFHPAFYTTIASGEMFLVPIFDQKVMEYGPVFIKDGLKLLQNPKIFTFDFIHLELIQPKFCHLPIKYFLESLESWSHLCDPILGHTLIVVLYLQGFLSEFDKWGQKYTKKWWTFHLAECSPHSPHSDKILHLLDSPGRLREICNIDGSERVIEWLMKVSNAPEDLITRWDDYRQSLIIQSSPSLGSSSESGSPESGEDKFPMRWEDDFVNLPTWPLLYNRLRLISASNGISIQEYLDGSWAHS